MYRFIIMFQFAGEISICKNSSEICLNIIPNVKRNPRFQFVSFHQDLLLGIES